MSLRSYIATTMLGALSLFMVGCSTDKLSKFDTLDKPVAYPHMKIETVMTKVPPIQDDPKFIGGNYPLNKLTVNWYENPRCEFLLGDPGQGEMILFRDNVYTILRSSSPLIERNYKPFIGDVTYRWGKEGFALLNGELISPQDALGNIKRKGGDGIVIGPFVSIDTDSESTPPLKGIKNLPYVRVAAEDPKTLKALGEDLYENACKISK